jgi:serine/threonine protein kinase
MADVDSVAESVAIERLIDQTANPLRFQGEGDSFRWNSDTLTAAEHPEIVRVPERYGGKTHWIPVAATGHLSAKQQITTLPLGDGSVETFMSKIPRLPYEPPVKWYVLDGPRAGERVWTGSSKLCKAVCHDQGFNPIDKDDNNFDDDYCCISTCKDIFQFESGTSIARNKSLSSKMGTSDDLVNRCTTCIAAAMANDTIPRCLPLQGDDTGYYEHSGSGSCRRGCGFMTEPKGPDVNSDAAHEITRAAPWKAGQPNVDVDHGGCVSTEFGNATWSSRTCDTRRGSQKSDTDPSEFFRKYPMHTTVVEFNPTYAGRALLPNASTNVSPSAFLPASNVWQACGPQGLCTCLSVVASGFLVNLKPPDAVKYVSEIGCARRQLIEIPIFGGVAAPAAKHFDITSGALPTTIALDNNNLISVPDGHFDSMPSKVRLLGVNLNDNLLTKLPIIKLVMLKILTLRYNRIERLDLGDLEGIPNLQELDLGWNLITKVVGSSFPTVLQTLDLNGNSIREISIAAVQSLPSGDPNDFDRFRFDLNPDRFTEPTFESGSICEPPPTSLLSHAETHWADPLLNTRVGQWRCCCASGYGDLGAVSVRDQSLQEKLKPCLSTNQASAGKGAIEIAIWFKTHMISLGCEILPETDDADMLANMTQQDANFSSTVPSASTAAIVAASVASLIAIGILASYFLVRSRISTTHNSSHVSEADILASAALLARLRPSPGSVSVVDARMASKFVAVARQRAESRFVIEYRQLVSERSMADFQREFCDLEITRSDVSVGAELGRGQFGVVLVGSTMKGHQSVAVKARLDAGSTAVGESAVAGDEALVLEALLLNGLQHPGIVKLLAVVTKTAPVMICTELMPNGDLRNFLQSCRPPKIRGTGRTHAQLVGKAMDCSVMAAMAAKLSSAMAFLENSSIIHRDVAARNVLVGQEVSDVKIADLGAARNVLRTSESTYAGVYVATTEHNPARWMPLEALQEAKFSVKSDVFSFGVLLWEILTLGRTPWGAFPVQQFVIALEQGKRLQLPTALEQKQEVKPGSNSEAAESSGGGLVSVASSPDTYLAKTIYAIACRCWAKNPKKRPHFHQIAAEFAIHQKVSLADTRNRGEPSLSGEACHGSQGSANGFFGRQAEGGTIDRSRRTVMNPACCAVEARTASADPRWPALDLDGYVDDVSTTEPPVLDADGFVDDVSTTAPPGLDADGYVDDVSPTNLSVLDADGYVDDHANNTAESHQSVDGRSICVVASVGDARTQQPRISEIGQGVQSPSVRLEFSDERRRSLLPGETRL